MLNKVLKIALCCMAGMCALVVTLGYVAVNVVFTPDRITQLAREQLSKCFTCQTDIRHVELTFFSTFPRVVLHAQDFSLVNSLEGAPSDTLLALHSIDVPFSPLMLYARHRVDIGEVQVSGLRLSLYTAADGQTNYDIMEYRGERKGLPFGIETICVEGLRLESFTALYVNHDYGIESELQHLVARMHGPIAYPADSLDLLADVRFASFRLSSNQGHSLALSDWSSDNLHLCMSDGLLLSDDIAMSFGDLSLSCPDTASPFSLRMQKTSALFTDLSLCDGYDFSYRLHAEGLKLSTGEQTIGNLPINVSGNVKSSTALDRIDLIGQDWRIGKERLFFDVSLHRLDSTRSHLDVNLNMQPTTFDRLLPLVRPVLSDRLESLPDVHGTVDNLGVSLSLGLLSSDSLLCQRFAIHAQLSDIEYLTDMHHWSHIGRCGVALRYPVAHADFPIEQFVELRLAVEKAHALLHDSTRYELLADSFFLHGFLGGESLEGSVSFPYILFDTIAFNRLSIHADTLSANFKDLNFDLMLNELSDGRKSYDAKIDGQDFELSSGLSVSAVGNAFQMEASSLYEPDNHDLLLRYNPVFNMTVENANIEMSSLPYSFEFPRLDFDFSLGVFMVREWLVNYGNSYLSLAGEVTNLRNFLQHMGSLKADLTLNSSYVDVLELRDLIDGLGASEDPLAVPNDEVSNYLSETLGSFQPGLMDSLGQAPFTVPRNLDLLLDVNLERAKVGRHLFSDLGGRVQIQEGLLRFENIGFNSAAARMVLNSSYQSPHRDNLLLSANVHLFDVQIDSLVSLVPGIDSIMPMLLGLSGSGEFHLDVDATLSGNYAPDLSTLCAQGAFLGTDLSLLDVESFRKMSRYLRFSKNTANRFDSLDVVFSADGGLVHIFPFMVGMDRYRTMVSGTHRLIGSVPSEYHVSFVKAPLVGGRLGVNVTGDVLRPKSLRFRLTRCRFGQSMERTTDEDARFLLTEKLRIFNEIKKIKSR